MIVVVNRSGGYAGDEMETVARVDVASLDAGRARRIKGCIDTLDKQAPSVGTDMIRYDIEVVDDNGQRKTLIALDDYDPESPLRGLLGAVGVTP